jgi:glutamate racemase
MRDNKNIAFFDSGIGGLTVLKTALSYLPDEQYIYYADTKNAPYGTKTKQEIKKHLFNAVEFLSTKNIKLLVIACNTATSAAINELRKTYSFPIIGMEPAVKPAIDNTQGKKILVLATTFTLNEQKLQNLITNFDKNNQTTKLALDKLVQYAENFDFDSTEIITFLKTKLDLINILDYDTIVLGCTHFIFYKTIIEQLIPKHIKILDGNVGTIKQMLRILNKDASKKNSTSHNVTFYSSSTKSNEAKLRDLLN